MNLTSLVRKLESECKRAEKLARHYDAQANALRGKLSTVAGALGKLMTGKVVRKKRGKKRRMSAAHRARIVVAQYRRWAVFRAKHGRKIAPRKGKRGMSAAGRARIVAAQKKRWAKVRAMKGKGK